MARRIKTAGEPDATTETSAAEPEEMPKKFCGDCGAEWPHVRGEYVMSCGHVRALSVDDPSKAKAINPPAGLRVPPGHERRATTMPGGSSSNVAPINTDDVGETVSATWGEELYTPQQFFTYRVGPFSRQTKIRAGETAVTAKARIEAELEQMAAAERTKKMTIFLDTMKELFTTVKKYQGEKS